MNRKLFGTDGVRGIANGENMTPEIAMELGRALGATIRNEHRTCSVVIGKDTRLSGYMLEFAMAAGITSVGVDVWVCGPLPTPGIAFLTHSMRADAGIVISASHNPFEDNGIKIFAHDGFKLPDAKEAELERLMFSDELKKIRATGDDIGRMQRIDDAGGRYIVHLKSYFPKALDLAGVKLVIDTAHGASYRVAPLVFSELGAEVTTIGNRPDGTNINAGVGALHPESLAKAVREQGADLGIALDGDADRIICVDEKGEVVDGDQLMAIFARELHAQGKLTGGGIVATVMSNLGLERSLAEVGLKLHRSQVGDRYVVQMMKEFGINLGGEQSGHIVYLDHATTGDGIVAGLMLLAAARRRDQRVSELRKCLTLLPQALVNVKVARRADLAELPAVQSAIKAAEKKLGDEGRVLVRFSGTEAKVRVMVEGPDSEGHANAIADAVRSSLS